jgi:hypothetical protein
MPVTGLFLTTIQRRFHLEHIRNKFDLPARSAVRSSIPQALSSKTGN